MNDKTSIQHSERETFYALMATNLMLGLLALGILAAFLYAQFIYQPEFDPQQAALYTAEAKDRLAKHSEAISQEVATVAQEALPPLTEAFYQQAREDYPIYVNVLQSQGDEYLTNVELILRTKLRRNTRITCATIVKCCGRNSRSTPTTRMFGQCSRISRPRSIGWPNGTISTNSVSKPTVRSRLWKQVAPVEVPGPNEPSLTEQLADYTADWTALAATEVADEQLSGEGSSRRFAERSERAPADRQKPANPNTPRQE